MRAPRACGTASACRPSAGAKMVQKWLGHAQLTRTAIYANAVGEEEQSIAAPDVVSHPPASAKRVPFCPSLIGLFPREPRGGKGPSYLLRVAIQVPRAASPST
jgi:hypothetical protein